MAENEVKILEKYTIINRTIPITKRPIEYIVVHYVGAVSTAKNNADYFYSTFRDASAHYFVDEKEIWQVVEDKNIAWHCGAKVYYHPCRNYTSIGVELCCKKKDGKWYFEKETLDNAVWLIKRLMKKYRD